jgi:uncharacterized protein (DUF488 family)
LFGVTVTQWQWDRKVAMPTVFTVGHGTRTTDDLARILKAAGVGRLIDVRRFPGSRRHPHFAQTALERDLPERGIAYEWRGEQLGGRRSRKSGVSRHTALTNKAFQGYADYMDTSEFREALRLLEMDAAADPPLAVMCAETLWWRCHRKMIADALTLDGVEVVHLIDERSRREHRPPQEMRADEKNRPVYDGGAAPLFQN